jgi:hypothetical protein
LSVFFSLGNHIEYLKFSDPAKVVTMKAVFYFVVFFNFIHFSLVGQSLLSKVDSLKTYCKFYVYTGSGKIYLTSLGSLERQCPEIVFKSVDHEKNTGLTSVEGLIDNCCFEIIVGKMRQKDTLTNIRHFGKTEEIQAASNVEGFTGVFKFTTRFDQKDVIIIGHPGTIYWLGVIIPIGKILATE